MIEIKDVSKSFKITRKQKKERGLPAGQRRINAVNQVTLTCRPGRIFTLLGPNGAGKTTLLRMVATMLKPDSGTIKVAGFDTRRQSQQVRRSIGFLTGSTELYKRLTPREIVRYYASLFGIRREVYEKREKELFDLLEIQEFAGKRVGKLSTGMKQKVSIARTMIHDPGVVVFDEPTVGLDVLTSKNIIRLIRDCRDRGKTVIFSTHIMGEVGLLSDDMAIIHRGEILYSGSFDEFLQRKKGRTIEDEFVRIIGGNHD